MSDTIIFIVGAFVTMLWGSMVGMLLYAVNTPINRVNKIPFKDIDNLDTEVESLILKRSNK